MTPLRLGLVGLNFGKAIAQELTTTPALPVTLAKVCDLDAAKAAAIGAEFNVPTSPSLEALLDDPDIDVIGLFCGPNGRADLIRQIICAGKDVMTTKPFEVHADAACAVLQEARALGRVVHLNSPNPRPYGEAAVISEWIRAGAIGKPTLAQANVWVYYGPSPADGSWYDDPLRCPLAPVFRLGIYPLNTLLCIFSEPETVQVTCSRVETRKPTPDNASLTIGFRDGGIVNVIASFVVGGRDQYKNALTIGGTEGVIYFKSGPQPSDNTPQPNLYLSTTAGIEARTVTRSAGNYDWEFFAQRVRGEVAEDVTTPAQVATAIRVVQAMSLAERSGQTVRVNDLTVAP